MALNSTAKPIKNIATWVILTLIQFTLVNSIGAPSHWLSQIKNAKTKQTHNSYAIAIHLLNFLVFIVSFASMNIFKIGVRLWLLMCSCEFQISAWKIRYCLKFELQQKFCKYRFNLSALFRNRMLFREFLCTQDRWCVLCFYSGCFHFAFIFNVFVYSFFNIVKTQNSVENVGKTFSLSFPEFSWKTAIWWDCPLNSSCSKKIQFFFSPFHFTIQLPHSTWNAVLVLAF